MMHGACIDDDVIAELAACVPSCRGHHRGGKGSPRRIWDLVQQQHLLVPDGDVVSSLVVVTAAVACRRHEMALPPRVPFPCCRAAAAVFQVLREEFVRPPSLSSVVDETTGLCSKQECNNACELHATRCRVLHSSCVVVVLFSRACCGARSRFLRGSLSSKLRKVSYIRTLSFHAVPVPPPPPSVVIPGGVRVPAPSSSSVLDSPKGALFVAPRTTSYREADS